MKISTTLKALSAFCMVFLSTYTVNAQQLKGTVVTEDGVLPGVVVSVEALNRSTTTNIDGTFVLNVNNTGTYDIKISFLGFPDITESFEIEEGINDLGTIKLEQGDSMLDEIVIAGFTASSQAKAYSIKKNSLAIMDVIAADAMGKLPDRNAAEAVQRVQGVAVSRYHGEADQATVRGTPFAWTSTLVNGNRLPNGNVASGRSTVLNVVPSELIQYVQVSKALTPDMEGDAIGGSVNFITKTAPYGKILGGSVAGGYNDFSGRETYNGSIAYGDRFFNNKLGVILVGAVWDRQWGADAFDVSYNTGAADPMQKNAINNVMFKRYMGKRQTYGLNLGLEYEFNNNHKVFGRALYDKFNDIRPVYESYIDYARSRYQYNYRYSHYQTKLSGGELGGNHQLSDAISLDWAYSDYTSEYYLDTPSTNNRKGLPIANFYQPITGGFTNRSADGLVYWDFDGGKAGSNPLHFNPALANPSEVMDPDQLTLASLIIMQLDTKEQDRTAQINLKAEASPKLSFKTGVKFRTKERESMYGSMFVYGGQGGTLSSMTREPFKRSGNFFDQMQGNFNYGSLIMDPLTKNQLFDLYRQEYLDQHNFLDLTAPTNATNIYTATENVYAGYAMAVYNATDNLTIIGGVRNEFTETTMNGTIAETTANGETVLSPAEINNDYNAFLPMLHFKYDFDRKTKARFAYTKTFIRPEFAQMSPGESINMTGADIVISRGNSGLRPTFSHNFDLMGEHYFDNVGLLSGGVFYKQITDIVFTNETRFIDNNNSYIINEAKNLEDASLFGFEAGINKRLSFLPGFWGGFGVEVNYTFIDSKVNVPRQYMENGELMTTYDQSSLPDQSKHLANVILFYENDKLMVRLAGNYRGRSVNRINQNLGTGFYTWIDDNFTVDASASYSLSKKTKFFLEVNNITNEPLKAYMGDKRRITSYEWYGIRGQVGVRFDLY
ncbi:MAG TPA: TonB-dependent receptor [Flavobacterium sp.]|nr:TonB-dependent receptor [Flavobacterium sp.]